MRREEQLSEKQFRRDYNAYELDLIAEGKLEEAKQHWCDRKEDKENQDGTV
jgi:hypothetical protein